MRYPGLISVFILFLSATLVSGQTLDRLQDDAKKLEDEIRIANELLSQTKSQRQVSQNELKLIQNKISNRRGIVSNLDRQSTVITNDITEKGSTVQQLQDDLAQLKKEYTEMVYNAYKNYKLNNFLVFLFASRDFNDATRRIAYMRRYNRMRQQKAGEITTTTAMIADEITQLEGQKDELVQVRQGREAEINALAKDQSEYQTSSNRLLQQENRIAAEVKSKQQQFDKLQQQIKDMIAAEARRNNSPTLSAAEREYIANLTGRFDQNMGQLPYPVRSGVIVDQFGMHAHPTLRGITVNNNGVNIAAGKGAEVRTVFDGDVKQVVFIQGTNNSVLISHGNFITVYSNLTEVSVKSGDKVALNQTIGRLSSSDNSDDCILHFEIWKLAQGSGNPTNLNPASWIRR